MVVVDICYCLNGISFNNIYYNNKLMISLMDVIGLMISCNNCYNNIYSEDNS